MPTIRKLMDRPRLLIEVLDNCCDALFAIKSPHGIKCYPWLNLLITIQSIALQASPQLKQSQVSVRVCLLIFIPLPLEAHPSAKTDNFIKHMQQKHDEVRCHIAASNDIYKDHADKRHCFLEFSEGDMVMVHTDPESLRANKKLHPRNAFKVLKKLSSNANTLELPSDLGIGPVFNVADPTLYRGHDNEEDSEEQAITLSATRLLLHR